MLYVTLESWRKLKEKGKQNIIENCLSHHKMFLFSTARFSFSFFLLKLGKFKEIRRRDRIVEMLFHHGLGQKSFISGRPVFKSGLSSCGATNDKVVHLTGGL